jgi:hypothetical protein
MSIDEGKVASALGWRRASDAGVTLMSWSF